MSSDKRNLLRNFITEYSKNMLVLVGAYIYQNQPNKCMANPVTNKMMHADHMLYINGMLSNIQAVHLIKLSLLVKLLYFY